MWLLCKHKILTCRKIVICDLFCKSVWRCKKRLSMTRHSIWRVLTDQSKWSCKSVKVVNLTDWRCKNRQFWHRQIVWLPKISQYPVTLTSVKLSSYDKFVCHNIVKMTSSTFEWTRQSDNEYIVISDDAKGLQDEAIQVRFTVFQKTPEWYVNCKELIF